MKDWRQRITTNPDQCGGRPCIRGMRIRVVDVLDLLAAGLSHEQILEELPDLKKKILKLPSSMPVGKLITRSLRHETLD